MNTLMWSNPLTGRHLNQLVDLGREASSVSARTLESHGDGNEPTPSHVCQHCGSKVIVGRLTSAVRGSGQGPHERDASTSSGCADASAEAPPDDKAAHGSNVSRSEYSSAPRQTPPSRTEDSTALASPALLPALTRRDAVTVVPPVSKRLACGDFGIGAMASVEDVVAAVRTALEGVILTDAPINRELMGK